MSNYGIFESTNIRGKNLSFVSDRDLENGMLVHKGELVAGSKDVYNAIIPTATTMADQPVFVIGDPAWSYDNSSIINQNEEEYIIPAGKVFRVYSLAATDKFAVASYGIDGATDVGRFINAMSASSATAPTSSAFVGEIIAVRELGYQYHVGQDVDARMTKVTIEVVKNG
jgi:hypothetical protein